MKRHPVLAFYLLALLISWTGWAPMVLASRGVAFFQAPIFMSGLILPTVGPALAAVLVYRRIQGRSAARKLIGGLFHWRVPAIWYAAALGLPLILLLLGKWSSGLLGLPGKPALNQQDVIAAFITTLIISLLSNPWEEVGWRGFALPLLQGRYDALRASILVGLMWALWHLPLFFWSGHPMSEGPLPTAFGRFLGTMLLSALVYTWLFNSTGGNIFITSLYHVTWNSLGAIITDVSEVVLMVEIGILALIILLKYGWRTLSTGTKVVQQFQT